MRPTKLVAVVLVAAAVVVAPAVVQLRSAAVATVRTAAIPRPAHTVVIMMENHSYRDIIGNRKAPYLNSLAKAGALLTRSFAVTHPSQPNYLALFSGSTHGVTSDSCPHSFSGPNLGSELRAAHDSFVGYAESLPSRGYAGCVRGNYARKHCPWVDFSDLPASLNRPLTSLPARLADFPTLAFITPNLQDDMHNGTIAEADQWLRHRLGSYIQAARHSNNLIVITWDEDDYSEANQIPTIMIGGNVRPGRYPERVNHYNVLRTLELAYRLRPLGHSAGRAPILNIWKHSAKH